jgi:hypothetical protein
LLDDWSTFPLNRATHSSATALIAAETWGVLQITTVRMKIEIPTNFVQGDKMAPKLDPAVQAHLDKSNAKLTNLLTGAQLNSSYIVITAWCHYAPDWDDTLESLWNKTGSSDWKPTPAGPGSPATYGVGSATLAQMLANQNHGRYGGTIDQKLILSITPNTVDGLTNTLKW